MKDLLEKNSNLRLPFFDVDDVLADISTELLYRLRQTIGQQRW